MQAILTPIHPGDLSKLSRVPLLVSELDWEGGPARNLLRSPAPRSSHSGGDDAGGRAAAS